MTKWEIIQSNNEKFKCFDCKHQATSWAQKDDVTEWNEGEQADVPQVRCPNCKSWNYWND